MAKVPTKNPRPINPVQDSLSRMSYSDIARKSGVTFGFCSLLFRGHRSAKVDTLERIAGALGVSITELHAHLKAVPRQSERHGWQKSKPQVGATA